MYKTILVPLDGSKRAEGIMSHVEQLALRYRAKIILLKIVRSPKLTSYASSEVRLFQEKFEELKKDAENYLTAVKGEFREKGIDTRARVTTGPVVKEILDAAERENADLIAICSHGRGGLSRMFYGSVATGIMHRVDRPLLLIRCRGDL